MPRPIPCSEIHVFSTVLGWMAMLGQGDAVVRLVFGYDSADAALAALDPAACDAARIGRWNRPLAQRLRAYAGGHHDDFLDVRVDSGAKTAAQRAVLARCRRIPYGQTLTYGQLAQAAALPRAARFVGNCMAMNHVPLIIPCHRVVPAGGQWGRYSAVGGTDTKRRLLEMEAAAIATRAAVLVEA